MDILRFEQDHNKPVKKYSQMLDFKQSLSQLYSNQELAIFTN